MWKFIIDERRKFCSSVKKLIGNFDLLKSRLEKGKMKRKDILYVFIVFFPYH